MPRPGLLLFLLGLSLFGHKTGSVTLAWDAPRGKQVIRYRVYYADITGHKAAKAKSLDVGLTTRAVVPNLVVGHTYYFTVTAFNSKGRESLPSNLVKYVVRAAD
jgi:Fibronectin type III domain